MATTRARGRERGQPPDPECAPRVRRRTNDARRSSIEANKREAGPFSKVANFPGSYLIWFVSHEELFED
jgi:hypothetical protein